MKVKDYKTPNNEIVIDDFDFPNRKCKMVDQDDYAFFVPEKRSFSRRLTDVSNALKQVDKSKIRIWHTIASCDKLTFKSKRFFINRPLATKPISKTQSIYSLDKERAKYEINLETYLESYSGKYIALQNEIVIDSDIDFSKLATRVYEKNGYKPVFITLVSSTKKLKAISPRKKQTN